MIKIIKNWKLILSILASIASISGVYYQFFLDSEKNRFTTVSYGDNSKIVQANTIGDIHFSDEKNPDYLNKRPKDLLGLNPKDTVIAYFELQNRFLFREACSLLQRQDCNAQDGESVDSFLKERSKYVNGFENLKIWIPDNQPQYTQVICSKYAYLLKADANPSSVTEIISFYLSQREDGEWEIITRTCEKKFKENSGLRKCDKPATIKYCVI